MPSNRLTFRPTASGVRAASAHGVAYVMIPWGGSHRLRIGDAWGPIGFPAELSSVAQHHADTVHADAVASDPWLL